MADVAALGLRVDGVEGVDKAGRALDGLARASRDAERGADKASGAIKRQGQAAQASSVQTNALARAARSAGAVLAAAFSIRALGNYADAWSDMTSLVKVNISAQEDAADVMTRLGNIARGTYSSLEQTARGFSINAFTLRALGKTTQQQLDYTEAMNNALVVSGARGEMGAMVQESLNRAMATGTLRGRELQNVLNYGSRVAGVLAEELGVNVTELRGLAAQGKITGEVVFNALTKNMEKLRAEAAGMPATISDAFIIMRNSILEAVGVYDKAGSLSERFAESIIKVADIIRETDWTPYINALVTAAKVYGAFLLAVKAAPGALSLADTAMKAHTAVMVYFNTRVGITASSLFTLSTAVRAVAAAFIGWEIGTYLRENFEWAEKAGIRLASWIHQFVVLAKSEFSILGENIKFAFSDAFGGATHAIAGFLEMVNGMSAKALRFFGLEGLADSLITDFSFLRSQTAQQHNAMVTQMRADTAREMAGISDVYADMFDQVGKSAKKAGKEIADAVNPPAAGGAAAAVVNDAVLKELAALQRAAVVWGKAADEIKLYDLAQMGATQGQLEFAKALMESVNARELAKQQADDYRDMVLELRTAEEKLTDQFRERITVLDAMASTARIASDEYARMADKATAAAFTEAPRFGGLAPEVGGAAGELLRVDDAQTELQDWYSRQMGMLAQFRADRADLNEQWDARELELAQRYRDEMERIDKARQTAQLAAGEQYFGAMAGAAKAFFGEQSRLYKAAFMIEKSFALTKALLNIPRSYSDAYAAMIGVPVIGPVLAPAAGAAAAAAQVAQAAAIRSIGMAHDGIDSVPQTGTWLLEKGERVTTAQTSAKLDATLSRLERGGGGGVTVNLIEDKSRAGQAAERPGNDRERIIDVFVADILGDGRMAGALQGKFGLAAQGR